MSNVLTIICVLRPLQICLPSKIIPVLWSVVIHPGVSPITDILSGIETCTSNGWGWRRGTRRSCPTTREYVRSILSRKTFNRTLKEGGLSLLLYVLCYLENSLLHKLFTISRQGVDVINLMMMSKFQGSFLHRKISHCIAQNISNLNQP